MPASPTCPSSCVERFLRYVTFDTQSDDASPTSPSTRKQLDLQRALVEDLRQIGLADAQLDEWGYVMATIPSSSPKTLVPTIGFVAHVDTSPEVSGAGVRPILHRAWSGADIVLPDDPTAVLRPSEIPGLSDHIGHDIITASGTTLLGADNKAGVAEIVGAAEFLMAHPEIPHGPIRLAFTPDEEIGRGADHFDVQRFGALYAYTVDGGMLGELEAETFSADSMTLTFTGFNTHPGAARGRMVNAIRVASDFISRLPRDSRSPETTADRNGFVHPYQVEAAVDRTSVRFLIRSFDDAELAHFEEWLASIARDTVRDWHGSSVAVSVRESYRNMRRIIDAHPIVIDVARNAIARAGVPLRETSVRGGTDGSRLSFMGLPTPNVFAGEQSIHSRLEWICTADMHKAVEVIVNIARIFEERAAR